MCFGHTTLVSLVHHFYDNLSKVMWGYWIPGGKPHNKYILELPEFYRLLQQLAGLFCMCVHRTFLSECFISHFLFFLLHTECCSDLYSSSIPSSVFWVLEINLVPQLNGFISYERISKFIYFSTVRLCGRVLSTCTCVFLSVYVRVFMYVKSQATPQKERIPGVAHPFGFTVLCR